MTFRLMSSTVVLAFLSVTTVGAFAADAGAISQQTPDQWRASKLAGLSVYGPRKKTVAKISDVLLSRD
ncbi:hypothetical protein [Lichenihabitans psoromatis]|uniref:hypothetical protein n=1 Tax=Lichenihabitans psoromatis TaxID=2528642 RepID=UPI001038463E|nr:hypothetical protein [Lichenihabitans psoromatis]